MEKVLFTMCLVSCSCLVNINNMILHNNRLNPQSISARRIDLNGNRAAEMQFLRNEGIFLVFAKRKFLD